MELEELPIYPDMLPPPSANFGGTMVTPTVTTPFTSGKIRRRNIAKHAIKKVNLEWLFTPEEFDIWEVFHREELNNGCNKFKLHINAGGIHQSGVHVVQCVEDYSFSHEEYNWRVSISCILFPYPVSSTGELLEAYIGTPIPNLMNIFNKYYDQRYQK